MSRSRGQNEFRVQELPYDEIQNTRDRELQSFRQTSWRPRSANRASTRYRVNPWPDSDDSGEDRERYSSGELVRRKSIDDFDRRGLRPDQSAYLSPRYRRNDNRRRDQSDSESDGQSERHRRRTHRHRSRADERRNEERSRSTADASKTDEIKKVQDDGYCWYSMKKRSEANFFEKHLDSSYDGLIAGVAGAALGSITAARFGGSEHKKLKAIGGAVLGAAAFNIMENHYRVFTEVREEVHEKKKDVEHGMEGAAKQAGRLLS